MPHIAVPDGVPGIRALLQFRPEVAGPMGALADVLLYAPNSLSRGDRELIASYVSSLNDCVFCALSHSAVAACHFNDDHSLVASVTRDPEAAPIPSKLKALLAVAARVRDSGRAVQESDIARARAEGATDVEIHDTVLIAAAFCMFNRYVDGLNAWTPTDPGSYRQRARHVAEGGYVAAVSTNVTK